MSEMVERVAADVKVKLDQMPFGERTVPRLVRLVIEAMREPTEQMNYQGAVMGGQEFSLHDAESVWHAMIEEALK